MQKTAVAVVLALLASVSSCGLSKDKHDQGILEGNVSEYSFPDSISGVAWEWLAPEGVVVSGTLPVPSGVALSVGDGVIVLDGEEGHELWSYRESDTSTPHVGVTSEYGYVILYFPLREAGSSITRFRTVVLDSRTGQVVSEYEQEGIPYSGQGSAHEYDHAGVLSREHRIRWSDEDGSLIAYNLLSDDQVWSQKFSLGSARYDLWSMVDVKAVSDKVFSLDVTYEDPRGREDGGGAFESLVSVTALDASDGTYIWEKDYQLDFAGMGFQLEVNEEDGSVAFFSPDFGWTVLDIESGETLMNGQVERRWDLILELNRDRILRAERSEDGKLVSYLWSDLLGEVERKVVTRGRPMEEDSIPPMDLGNQIIRLDYIIEDSLTRGPVTLESISWEDGAVEIIPLGFDLRGPLGDEEGDSGENMVVPEIVVTPGAVVISERQSVSTHVIGVS